ncbi:MAG: TetR/AcrR family transcriptional regulator C-terminal domain-containing protein [Eubacterium sp.]
MKNEERTFQTKAAMAGKLKELMQKKPLSKITVSEIIDECDINRKTFYYHFEDIYSLLKWMFEQEAIEVVKQFDLLIDAEEAIEFILDYSEKNKHIINCAYDSIGRDEMKRFFYLDFIGITKEIIETTEREKGLKLDGEFKEFLEDFYTEAFAGALINYIKSENKPDKTKLIDYISVICRQSITNIVEEKGVKY